MELKLDTPADQAIINAIRRGELREAARMMVFNCGTSVYTACYCFRHDPGEVEDLTQACFKKAFTKMETLSGATELSDWLLGIARTHCISQLQRESITWTSKEDFSTENARSHLPFSPPSISLLRQSFETLSPPDRMILSLRYLLNTSLPELGSIAKLTEEQCAHRLIGALVRLEQAVHRQLQQTRNTSPPVQPSSRATHTLLLSPVEEPYRSLVETIGGLHWRMSESLTRRLEALAKAL